MVQMVQVVQVQMVWKALRLLLGMVEGVVVAVVEAVAEVVRSVWPVTGWVVLVVPSVVAP